MKRLLTLALLLLLLAGCGAPAAETPTIPQETAQTEPAPIGDPEGLYDEAQSLALDPTGALRCYNLSGLEVEALGVMGEDLVLFSRGDTTTLLRLSGENRYVSSLAALPISLSAGSAQVNAKGLTYYDAEIQTLVFLSTTLEEVNRISLPEEIQGEPVLTGDRKTLYYTTGNTLRAMDLETKRDRLLLETAYDQLLPKAVHLDGTVLECRVQEAGEWFALYLRTDTGETLATAGEELSVASGSQLYFARLETTAYPELLVGTPGEEPDALVPVDYRPEGIVPVMALNSLMTAAREGEDTRLELYDLRTGDRGASMTIPGWGTCGAVAGDPATGRVWMVWNDGTTDWLLCWDPALSPAEDDEVYRLPRRTAENPDADGLAACAETAKAMGEAYGVEIRIWQEAVAVQPEDYTLVPEHRVPLIRESLKEVEALLTRFPAGFLEKLSIGEHPLRICLTGAISGQEEQTLDTATGVQFLDEAGDPYVAVTLDDGLTQSLTHELFHVIDSRVLGASPIYDDWNDLNPAGFDYDYDYARNAQREDTQWLEGEAQAFIDRYSMSFPREDRARIMEYALGAGNAEYFASETMQAKLRTLCRGIRDAFELKKSPETFPWEQYLEKSLAYTKKK